MTYTTTLKAIREHSPCEDGWKKLLNHLEKTKADDKPLPLLTILDSNGLDDALWCLRVLPAEHDNAVRLLVCDMVEPALQYTADPHPRQAVDTARRYAHGEKTIDELAAAWAAARDARAAAWAARAAAWAAAWDARAAAWAAARAAAWDARAAAWDAARAEQDQIFRYWLAARTKETTNG